MNDHLGNECILQNFTQKKNRVHAKSQERLTKSNDNLAFHKFAEAKRQLQRHKKKSSSLWVIDP